MRERIALADGRGAAEHKCGHDGGSYLSHEPAPPGPGARRRQGVEALGEGREGGDRLSRLVGFLRRFRLLSGKIGDELRLASRGGGELLLQRFDVSLQRLDVAFEGVREGLVRTACARGAHTLCTCGANGLCARGAHILCVFGDLNARTAVVAAPSRPFPAQGAIPDGLARAAEPFAGLVVRQPLLGHRPHRLCDRGSHPLSAQGYAIMVVEGLKRAGSGAKKRGKRGKPASQGCFDVGRWIPTRSATPSTALVPQRKVGFPIPNAGLLLGFQGTKTARREGISSPFSDAGGCTSRQNSGAPKNGVHWLYSNMLARRASNLHWLSWRTPIVTG